MSTLRIALLILLVVTGGTAFAAPNVTNATQKGSLLIWPDIRVDGDWNTIIRIQNDGARDVDILCYWMDGNKNRVDFVLSLTIFQPIWFSARNGFPSGAANGFDNPFLLGPFPPGTDPADQDEDHDTAGAYRRGMLACWAVDQGAQQQVKWNHLSGTATLYHPTGGSYEYNAYAFFVPTGVDLDPIGTAGILNLNGVEYDSCPQYQIASFTSGAGRARATGRRLAIVGCSLNLNQDWIPVYTKFQFDSWTGDSVKLTGAFDCADSWHEVFFGEDIDAGAQNFLGASRYRIQGVRSTQCPDSVAVGVLAVQSTILGDLDRIGTTLTAAGKFTGKIVWDPESAVPEGGIR